MVETWESDAVARDRVREEMERHVQALMAGSRAAMLDWHFLSDEAKRRLYPLIEGERT